MQIDVLPQPRRGRVALLRVAQITGTFVVFFVLNRLGFYFQIDRGVSIFYPATAADVVACMHFGVWGAIGIFLGGLASPWQPGETLVQTSISALLNVSEGMIPWLVFRLRKDLHLDLHDFRSLATFIVFGTIVNSAFSATLGNLLLIPPPASGRIDPTAWFMWWISDFSAAVLLATPLLAFAGPLFARMKGTEERPASRTLTNAVQITLVIIFLGWSASTAIQSYLENRIETERIATQQVQTELSRILTELEERVLDPQPFLEDRVAARNHLVRLQEHALAMSPDTRVRVDELVRMTRTWIREPAQISPIDIRRAVLDLRFRLESSQALTWQDYERRHARVTFVSLLMDQMVLLILILASIHLISRVTSPLRQMHWQVRELERGGHFDARRVDSNFVELAALAQALDQTSRALASREEDLRRETEKALAASRAKSDFLARMSHELRTPLNSVIGFSDLLKDETSSLTPEKRTLFLDNIAEGGRKLLRMINDLLDIAKIESGKMDFQFEIADLRLMVRNSISAMLPILERRDQHLELELPPDPIPVRADAGRLEQVFLNLLSNASKFSEPGTTVRVEAEHTGDECVVSVRDEGIGIDPNDHLRIFDEFEQSRATAASVEGTGLGLALVRRFVEAHGGRVLLDSRPDHGSTFRVVLPLAAKPARNGHAKPSS